MSKRGKVLAVVGAQTGSEAKGVCVSKIAEKYDIHVRTGGSNAGHTFMYHGFKHGDILDEGTEPGVSEQHHKIVMQTVPVGWINFDATLVLGVGSLIDLARLDEEIGIIKQFDPNIGERLWIDKNAGVISPWHAAEEGGVSGDMHQRIGSTGKGVGTARRDRLMRIPGYSKYNGKIVAGFQRMGDLDLLNMDLKHVRPHMLKANTALWLNQSIKDGMNVLLEGTQGQGLDLLHGQWPFVTSNSCGTAQLLNDCGIAPSYLTDTLLVARTFPIRVAGNSGPMYHETTWEEISKRVGKPTTEKTTVTKKTRRIGYWDDDLFDRAVTINGARLVAITFMDYMFPQDEGKTDWYELSQSALDWAQYIELRFGVKVVMLGTGWNESLQDYATITNPKFADEL